ncbi:18S rRNA maturation protein [Xylographa opegraphella]|nr:18S rRNA maturation protein [Xylographa opegraphella]
MGTKRPSGDATHPSRKPHISGHSNKRHKSSPYDNAIHSSHKSANNLKSKIRDLTRLLDHSKDLPADVRIEKERALAGYRVDLESAQGERRRSDMIKRYHMVRFFGTYWLGTCGISVTYECLERQKASRQLKRLQSQLDTVADESSERKTLQSAVHRAEVDLNYTMYYPLAEKYQSLYPRVEPHRVEDDGQTARVDETDKRRLEGRKPPLWPLIERAMRESTLEALRDGNGDRVVSVNTKSQLAIPRKAAAQGAEAKHILDVNRLGKTQSVGEALTDNNDDGASDGGFFEE